MMLMGEQLEFNFEFGCPSIEAEYYREGAQDLIHRLVPASLLETGGVDLPYKRARFSDLLPLISWSELQKAPCALSVLLLCKYRLNACNFFCEMISRWLLPSKKVNVELFFASDVRIPHLSEDLLSVAEIVIYLKSAAELEEVRRNMHAIETEIRLGVVSHYHARRILEFKGLSSDGKTAMIQEKISSLIQSHSKDFDSGIFSQMQQFLVTCPQDFKLSRDYHHISRIISNLHSLRKLLKSALDANLKQRQVLVKFLKTHLKTNTEEKPVLGILLGLNLLNDHEIFETEHLTLAIQKHIPQARLVEGSHFADRLSEVGQQTLYLEVEKENGLDFSLEEVQKLRLNLPDTIKGAISPLMRPIFMPRNDEEVLRNIMALSRQLRFIQDSPQVNISFDEQKGEELFFTVVLLRWVEEGDLSVQQQFEKRGSCLPFIADRVRKVGQLRRKIKEATVFRTTADARHYLREDQSIDLYQARSFVLQELQKVLGPLRDYNGGMIIKQSEQIAALKQTLGKLGDIHHVLLEKFYYSLLPMEMRTSLETEPLKQLFLLLLQSKRSDLKKKETGWVLRQDTKKAIAVLPQARLEDKKQIIEKLKPLSIAPHQLVHFSLDLEEGLYLGYLFLTEEKEAQDQFLKTLTGN